MKKTQLLAIIAAVFIVFLLIVLAIDPLRIAVRDFLAGVGGGTFLTLENGWAAIVASPIYMQLHVFIWFIGGMIFLGMLIVADRRGKIPLRKARRPTTTPVMGPPQTILVTAAPAPTSGPNPQQQPAASVPAAPPIPPVDPNKAASGGT